MNDNRERTAGDFHVICNWNDQAVGIIIQLRSRILQEAGEHSPIVVICDEPVDFGRYKHVEGDVFRFVEHVQGSPTDKSILERAHVGEAFSVVVLSSGDDADRADEKTLMTLFSLCGLDAYRRGNGPHVIAEVVSQRGREVIPKSLRDEFGGQLEILEGAAIRGKIFSHAARAGGGLTSLYFSILSYQADSNEVYSVPLPPQFEGMSFNVAAASLLLGAPDDRPLLPVGVRRNHRVVPNPHFVDGQQRTGSAMDQVAVLAYEPPSQQVLHGCRVIDWSEVRSEAPPRIDDERTATQEDETEEEHAMSHGVQAYDAGDRWVMQDHYIICNWNENAVEIIRELRSEILDVMHSEADHSVPIVVLTPKTVDLGVFDRTMDNALLRDLYFHPGEPTDQRFLEHVNATSARSVIVLSDERYGDLADSRTLLILFALREMVEKARARDQLTRPKDAITVEDEGWPMHVVAEIVDVDNYAKFARFEEESGNAVEILRGESLRTRILSQAARTPGLVEFFTDLLTHEDDSNEIYEFPFPDELAAKRGSLFGNWKGRRFREIAAELFSRVERLQDIATSPEGKSLVADCRMDAVYKQATTVKLDDESLICALKNRFEIVPIGIWRGRGVLVNPRGGGDQPDSDVMREGDELAVISYSAPCLYLYSDEAISRLEEMTSARSSAKGTSEEADRDVTVTPTPRAPSA